MTTVQLLTESLNRDPMAYYPLVDALMESGLSDQGAWREATILRVIGQLSRCSGGSTANRRTIVRHTLNLLTDDQLRRARLEECADERTGARFGRAQCRRGQCIKIGNSRFRYQLWLVWN
jgi:hypothetical protein